MRRAAIVVVTLAALDAGAAAAHSRCIPLGLMGPQSIGWHSWHPDALLVGNTIALAGAYGLGATRMWRGAGRFRGVGGRHVAAFALGLAALWVALASPIDALSAQLAWAHMVQHMLLMLVAAPLVVAGKPLFVLRRALGLRAREGLSRTWRRGYWLWQPALAWALYALTLWIWHLPTFYARALRDPFVHDMQHMSFFLSSCLFWGVLLHPLGRRLGALAGGCYIFTTTLHASVLGVFMALSPRLWYVEYAATAPAWGVSAMEDQQLAGLIMWMPACLIYAVAAALLFAHALREPPCPPEGRQRREPPCPPEGRQRREEPRPQGG